MSFKIVRNDLKHMPDMNDYHAFKSTSGGSSGGSSSEIYREVQRYFMKKQIILSKEQLKQIARYEMTFQELLADTDFDDVDFECTEPYQYTLEDLAEALRNVQKENPTVGEFDQYWNVPINALEYVFGLDDACGYSDDEYEDCVDDTDERLNGFPEYGRLFQTEEMVFSTLWNELEEFGYFYEEDMPILEVAVIEKLLLDLERYLANKEKPVNEWLFTEEEKEGYITPFENDEFLAEATEAEVALCRKFIEELCELKNKRALHIKAYACYGGNRLYSCDWPTSRDYVTRLFEKTDNAQYANTLGYIYYYGRCTDGVPEYDKAFYYFGISAANGLYEGMYKLADMFRHGYGCKKSLRTAYNLYSMVYTDSLDKFVKGDHANFADAALRMGNVYAKGIDEEINPVKAYRYYLQADYAAKLRAKENDFFGNTTVAINIQTAIDEIKTQLPENYFKETYVIDEPIYLNALTDDNYRCELKRTLIGEADWKLEARRLPRKRIYEPEAILITIPPIQLCERTTDVTVTAKNVEDIWFKDEGETIRYDCAEWNYEEARYDFFYDEELTGWIKSECYEMINPKYVAPNGKLYHFASVCFQANGRTYDYLCEFDDVQSGDTVIVNGYNGETEVTVKRLFSKYESELGLPIERFKSILKKKRTRLSLQ